MCLLDNFPHRCSIQILVPTPDGIGGNQLVPTVQQTDVKCWEQKLSHDEMEEFDKRGMDLARKIYFLTDPAVTEKHEIIITSRDAGATTIAAADQIALKVKSESMPDASAGLGVVYKVIADNNPGGDR